MSNAFDPYYTWLGISPAEQPPNHYRLLGIPLYENNPDVISNAADRQMAHIRTFQGGKHSGDSQRLLNELSAARVVLLDPAKRAAYDAQLQSAAYAAMQAGYAAMGNVPQPPMVGQPQGMMPQQMPPQMPPQGVMPQGVGVPAPPPVQDPILGGNGARKSSGSKKRKPQKNDPTPIYAAVGGGAAVLIAAFLMFSGGSDKKTEEIAKAPESTIEDSLEDISMGMEMAESADELDFRPAQENVMQELEKKEPTKKAAVKETAGEEEDEGAFDLAGAGDSLDDPVHLSEEDLSREQTDAEKKKEAEKKKSTSRSKADEEEEEDPEEKPEKKKTDSGISRETIENLGRGAALHTASSRETMMKFYGADTKKTQTGTTAAVTWLMEKMLKDRKSSYWNFDHTLLANGKPRPNARKYQNPGLAKENPVSATTLAMMAVLGSGELDEKDMAAMQRVILALMNSASPASDEQVLPAMRENAKRIEATLAVEQDARAGFHPHAWGTAAVCDYISLAREMKDRKEKQLEAVSQFAQALVKHISRQQLTDGGFPEVERRVTIDFTMDPAPSSVKGNAASTVWNLIALKSAKDAGIAVPNSIIMKANEFLSNQILLLSKKKKDFENLSALELREMQAAFFGIQIFGKKTPEYADALTVASQILDSYDADHLEGNFFASMLLRDLQGEVWDGWNEKVFPEYLKKQSADEVEGGSWFYGEEDINNEGGRLYCTAMALLILESYYRYEPLRPFAEFDEYEAEKEKMLDSETDSEEMVSRVMDGQAPAEGNAFAFERPPLEEDDTEQAEAAEAASEEDGDE
ncbi:MAG: hypothetical protein J6J31_13595 [Thermoguttaceae bacterium]|nr:hypothetical protein [Thermoguttaceae bacterium]